VRYHGILAPAASCPDQVLPRPSTDSDQDAHRPGGGDAEGAPRERRLSWSKLLARVFSVDVLSCPRCGATMRLMATIHAPESVRKILGSLGFASRPPPISGPATLLAPEDQDWIEPAWTEASTGVRCQPAREICVCSSAAPRRPQSQLDFTRFQGEARVSPGVHRRESRLTELPLTGRIR
jgi:hypothetical protein